MQSACDLLRGAQHRDATGGACRLNMKRRDAPKFWVDLSEKRTQMKLSSEQAAGEISDHPGLDVARINPRLGNGTLRGLENNVANRLALLLEIALEVGPPGANDINRLGHNRMPQEANPEANQAQRVRAASSTPQFAGCPELCQLLASESQP